MLNWEYISPQPDILPVHFFVASFKLKYTDFINASSVGYSDFVFYNQKNATKKENIGVENASDEAISHIISFDNLKKKENNIFTMTDLMENGLCSGKNSKEKRIMLGNILNIGYYNSKQFSHALNSFNITKEEFQRAMNKIK